jgi:hypothetical protein
VILTFHISDFNFTSGRNLDIDDHLAAPISLGLPLGVHRGTFSEPTPAAKAPETDITVFIGYPFLAASLLIY